MAWPIIPVTFQRPVEVTVPSSPPVDVTEVLGQWEGAGDAIPPYVYPPPGTLWVLDTLYVHIQCDAAVPGRRIGLIVQRREGLTSVDLYKFWDASDFTAGAEGYVMWLPGHGGTADVSYPGGASPVPYEIHMLPPIPFRSNIRWQLLLMAGAGDYVRAAWHGYAYPDNIR